MLGGCWHETLLFSHLVRNCDLPAKPPPVSRWSDNIAGFIDVHLGSRNVVLLPYCQFSSEPRLIPPSFVNPWQIAWICQTSSISIRWHRRVRFPLNNSFLNIKKWIKHFSSKHLISGNYSPNSSCRTIEVHYLHCPIYYSNVWTTYLTSALCCHRK